jgi:outer membrane protein OmpA-like peptidoglycan-associated protein
MAAVGLLLHPATSPAQTKTAGPSGEFSVQNLQPAPGTKNFISVEGVRMDGAWGFSVGFFANYARNPFVVLSCRSQTDCNDKNAKLPTNTAVVSDMFTADVLAALSPVKRLQIGLRLPVSYVSGAGLDYTTGQGLQGGQKAFGVGDPTIEGKVRVFGGAQDPYLAGLALDLSFPVGHAFSHQDSAHPEKSQEFFLGNSSPVTAGLRAIFDGSAGPVQFGLNLRGVFRAPATIASTTVGPADFRYGAGLGFRVSPIFRVVAEGFGSTQFSSKSGTNTLEADAAAEFTPLSSRLLIRVGGGAGILEGVGVPQGRAFLGFAYVHEIADQDGDGIPDDVDKCPTIPEDKDGFEDADGCPDPDNDGDKIPDEKDKCPNQPETVNGFQDDDGCPDEVGDRDKDGIPDTADKCPDLGGKDVIRDPKSQFYGCPDRDKDGVPDHLDKCPDVPEPTDDLFDGSGCPHVRDSDGDQIPDDLDKCPDKPENYNGFEDADGCPDKGPSLVEVSDTGIKILDKVEFATGKDVIQGAKSFAVLDAVAAILKVRKEILQVEVGGHTDNVGNADQNRKLSQKRAEAVVKYLASKQVDAARLQAKGYGPDKPVADNKTAPGRGKNRRVEFTILSTSKKTDVAGAPPPGPAAPAPAPAAPKPAPKK